VRRAELSSRGVLPGALCVCVCSVCVCAMCVLCVCVLCVCMCVCVSVCALDPQNMAAWDPIWADVPQKK
jgi:hypothetical protein